MRPARYFSIIQLSNARAEDSDRIVFKTGSSQIFQKVTDVLDLWAEKNQEQEYNLVFDSL